MQNVVDVGGNNQLFNRQAHLRGNIAGKHIAKVSGRDGKGNFALRSAQSKRGIEIIYHLRHQTGPVDGVYGG